MSWVLLSGQPCAHLNNEKIKELNDLEQFKIDQHDYKFEQVSTR